MPAGSGQSEFYTFQTVDPQEGVVEWEFQDHNLDGQWNESQEERWIADVDGDGLTRSQEEAAGSDPFNPDTDYDGLSDSDELHLTQTDPTRWDTNGDGFSDHDAFHGCWAIDYVRYGPGHSYFDWDGDGYPNHLDPMADDPENLNYWPDTDGDGQDNASDSHVVDPSLWCDWDRNGYNDDEEDWEYYDDSSWEGEDSYYYEDYDGDGTEDAYDSHSDDPYLWNDWDYNGVNDDEEFYISDSDGDGVEDYYDSQPWDEETYADWDGDGSDDYYSDWDGDGYVDSEDSHPDDGSLWEDWDGDGTNDSDQWIEEESWEDESWWDWEDDDGDGWANVEDSHPFDAAYQTDWDSDQLNEATESEFGSDPWTRDSDSDGLHDGEEHAAGTDPLDVDTDGDGLTDYDELIAYAGHAPPPDPLDSHSISESNAEEGGLSDWYWVDLSDSDPVEGVATGDGIPDRIEMAHGLDPNDPADALGDLDGDGVTNVDAYRFGIAMNAASNRLDFDDDGLSDAVETFWSKKYPGILSPYRFADAVRDEDGDGVLNYEEIQLGLDPGDPDSSTPEREPRFRELIGLEDYDEWEDEETGEIYFDLIGYLWDPVVHEFWAVQGYSAEDDSPDMALARQQNPHWRMPIMGDGAGENADGEQVAVTFDCDGDEMPDLWEHGYRPDAGGPGLNLRVSDGNTDLEPDELSNYWEWRLQYHPRMADRETDSDGDGVYDVVEVELGTNPDDETSQPSDEALAQRAASQAGTQSNPSGQTDPPEWVLEYRWVKTQQESVSEVWVEGQWWVSWDVSGLPSTTPPPVDSNETLTAAVDAYVYLDQNGLPADGSNAGDFVMYEQLKSSSFTIERSDGNTTSTDLPTEWVPVENEYADLVAYGHTTLDVQGSGYRDDGAEIENPISTDYPFRETGEGGEIVFTPPPGATPAEGGQYLLTQDVDEGGYTYGAASETMRMEIRLRWTIQPSTGTQAALKKTFLREVTTDTATSWEYEELVLDASEVISNTIELCAGGDRLRDSLNPTKFGFDQNGDGRFDRRDFDDRSSNFVFWINNDDDWGDAESDYGDTGDHVPVIEEDWKSDRIDCIRDLEDYTQLYIDVPRAVLDNDNSEMVIRWHPDSQRGALVRVARKRSSSPNWRYLTSRNEAQLQVSTAGGFSEVYPPIHADQELRLSRRNFPRLYETEGPYCLLLQGAGVGVGVLELVLEKDSGSMQLAQAPLSIVDVRRMFERAKVAPPYDTPSGVPDVWEIDDLPVLDWVEDDFGFGFECPPDETLDRIVFVHGWRMSYENVLNWGCTTFKRLWIRGYRGRFVTFRWPTYCPNTSHLNGYLTYSQSEYRALLSGLALAKYLSDTAGSFRDHIVAHSMGNMVVGSALNQTEVYGEKVIEVERPDTYAMLNAAMAHMSYGTTVREFADRSTPDTDQDPETNRLGLAEKFAAMGTPTVNYFLTYDDALLPWETNHRWNKPLRIESKHIWEVGRLWEYFPLFPLGVRYGNVQWNAERSVSGMKAWRDLNLDVDGTGRGFTLAGGTAITLPIESIPYLVKTRSKPIGNTPIATESIESVPLQRFGFSEAHSAQWDFPVQDVVDFYSDLLLKFGVHVWSE